MKGGRRQVQRKSVKKKTEWQRAEQKLPQKETPQQPTTMEDYWRARLWWTNPSSFAEEEATEAAAAAMRVVEALYGEDAAAMVAEVATAVKAAQLEEPAEVADEADGKKTAEVAEVAAAIKEAEKAAVETKKAAEKAAEEAAALKTVEETKKAAEKAAKETEKAAVEQAAAKKAAKVAAAIKARTCRADLRNVTESWEYAEHLKTVTETTASHAVELVVETTNCCEAEEIHPHTLFEIQTVEAAELGEMPESIPPVAAEEKSHDETCNDSKAGTRESLNALKVWCTLMACIGLGVWYLAMGCIWVWDLGGTALALGNIGVWETWCKITRVLRISWWISWENCWLKFSSNTKILALTQRKSGEVEDRGWLSKFLWYDREQTSILTWLAMTLYLWFLLDYAGWAINIPCCLWARRPGETEHVIGGAPSSPVENWRRASTFLMWLVIGWCRMSRDKGTADTVSLWQQVICLAVAFLAMCNVGVWSPTSQHEQEYFEYTSPVFELIIRDWQKIRKILALTLRLSGKVREPVNAQHSSGWHEGSKRLATSMHNGKHYDSDPHAEVEVCNVNFKFRQKVRKKPTNI